MAKEMKPWVKTALALSAVSVFLGVGYTAYYFAYGKKKKATSDNGGTSSLNNSADSGKGDVNHGLSGKGGASSYQSESSVATEKGTFGDTLYGKGSSDNALTIWNNYVSKYEKAKSLTDSISIISFGSSGPANKSKIETIISLGFRNPMNEGKRLISSLGQDEKSKIAGYGLQVYSNPSIPSTAKVKINMQLKPLGYAISSNGSLITI